MSTGELFREPKELVGISDLHPGRVEILQSALCYRNRDELRQL